DWHGGSKQLLAAAFTKAEAALPANSYRFIVRHIAPDDSEMTYISAEFRLLDPQSGSEGLEAPPVAWSYLDALPVLRCDTSQPLSEAQKQQGRENLGLGTGITTRLAAVVVSKSGARTEYVASENTDDARGLALTSAIQSMTVGQTLICSPGDYYMAQTNLLLVGACTYIWNGANLYINNASASSRSGRETVLDIALFTSGFTTGPTSVSNWKFIGPLTLNGGGISNRRGLWPIGTSGALVQCVTFKNWGTAGNGMAFYSFNSVGKGNRMSDCYFDSCAGTGAEFNAEYWVVSNCHALTCGNAFVESAGNTAFSNCSATFCTYGLKIMNTSNPGHGSWIGGNVNHCTTGIYTDPAISAAFGGWNFSGAIAHSTSFDLNGKGITWTGGEIANTSFVSTGANAGISYFRGVRLLSTSTAESTSLAALTVAKRATMVFVDCRTELGVAPSWTGPQSRETWVVEGDSWSAGTAEGNSQETWPHYIAKLIGPRVNIVNAATNGTTAQSMVGTFSAQCAPYLTATSGKPSTSFIFAGINDAGTRTVVQLRSDLRALWDAARTAGSRVVAFTLPFRSASGGWSDSDWLAVNANIIADASYYDVLVRTDIFHSVSNSETSDGLHITTAAHQKLASRVMDALAGRQMMPSLSPDLVCSSVGLVNFAGSTGGRRNIPFSEKYDANSDATNVAYGGDTATVFTAPATGTYEISASMLLGGMTSGNTAYLSAFIVLSGAAELEHRMDYQISPGANMTLKGTIRRRLNRGDTVAIAVTASNTATTILQNAEFGTYQVRLVSIP
ncbi:MAG: SGNH/GDSL hydrolase family protein, partial [Verrucomicrobiaceae bacterium]